MSRPSYRRALLAPGLLLGAGLGGFADGIVFHQIMQWHNMLSSLAPPTDLVTMKVNMFWDGLFHAFTWLMTVGGLALLWRVRLPREDASSTRVLPGAVIAGWGLFNVIEGLVDHMLLGLHHVHPGTNQDAWDVGFLVFGLALLVAGWALIRSGSPERKRVAVYQTRG